MSEKEWADTIVSVVDAVISVPAVLLVVLVIVGKHVGAIGRWLAVLIENRGFEATSTVGTFKVPGSTTTLGAEVETIAQLSAGTADPIQKAKLDALEQSLLSIKEGLKEIEHSNTGYFQRLIAERAKELLHHESLEHIPLGPMRIVFNSEDRPESSVMIKRLTDYALLAQAFSSGRDIDEATYEDFVEAARLMREEGAAVTDPPFDRETFQLARAARAMSFPRDPGGGWTT